MLRVETAVNSATAGAHSSSRALDLSLISTVSRVRLYSSIDGCEGDDSYLTLTAIQLMPFLLVSVVVDVVALKSRGRKGYYTATTRSSRLVSFCCLQPAAVLGAKNYSHATTTASWLLILVFKSDGATGSHAHTLLATSQAANLSFNIAVLGVHSKIKWQEIYLEEATGV